MKPGNECSAAPEVSALKMMKCTWTSGVAASALVRKKPPAIQPRYLSTPTDRDTVVAGLKLLRRIMRQPAMRRYIAEERAPDPRCTSDAELLAFARATGTTVFHPTSTCRMGSDSTAVVDERLRVHGIERLRVVDGSIMPTLVSGNTNAAIVMIAEKGADMILQDAVAERPISISASARSNGRRY